MKRIFAAVLFFYLLVGLGYYVNADMYIPLSPRIINHNLLVNGEVTAQGFVSQRESGEVGSITIYEDMADGNNYSVVQSPSSGTGFFANRSLVISDFSGVSPVVIYAGVVTGSSTSTPVDVASSSVVFPINSCVDEKVLVYEFFCQVNALSADAYIIVYSNNDESGTVTIPSGSFGNVYVKIFVRASSANQIVSIIAHSDLAIGTNDVFIKTDGAGAINNTTTELTMKLTINGNNASNQINPYFLTVTGMQ